MNDPRRFICSYRGRVCDYAIELQGIWTSDGADERKGTAGYKRWYEQKDATNGACMSHRRRGDPHEDV